MVGPRLFTGGCSMAPERTTASPFDHDDQILVDLELPKAIDMNYDFLKAYVRAPASYLRGSPRQRIG